MDWKVLINEYGYMVSADLSGTGKNFQPSCEMIYDGTICLLPEVDVSHSVTNQWLFCQMVIPESLSFVRDKIAQTLAFSLWHSVQLAI